MILQSQLSLTHLYGSGSKLKFPPNYIMNAGNPIALDWEPVYVDNTILFAPRRMNSNML